MKVQQLMDLKPWGCFTIAVAFTTAVSLAAQTPATPTFEVATIRASAPDTRGGGRTVTETRVDFRNTPLFRVLLDAYEVDEHRIAGPGWLKQTRFDIQATIPAGAARAQVPQMLQRLLADRFGLIAHVERRPVSVYALVVTGRGIKMLEVEPVNELTKSFPTAGGATSSDVVEGEGDKQTRTIMTTGGLKVVTTRALWDQRITNRGTWQVEATRMGMADLVMLLGGMVDRPVIDKTALTGVYQFKVELPGILATAGLTPRGGMTIVRDGTVAVDPSGISVFRAVEGLGLKLESRRSPLDVFVVDKIARLPTAN